MKQPLVSVVIPCYNVAEYVGATLDSVIAQSYTDWEVIAVNDGSKDHTLDVLRQYESAHPQRIRVLDVPNGGACTARNLGLSHSQGTYLQFLDADDVLVVDKWHRQIDLLERDDLAWVVGDYDLYDHSLEEWQEKVSLAGIEDAPLETAIVSIINTTNPLYRLSTVRQVGGYRPEWPSAQDYDFNLRVMLTGARVGYLAGSTFMKRAVPGSISSDWVKVSRVTCQVIESLKTDLVQDDRLTPRARRHLANLYYNTAIHAPASRTQLQHDLEEIAFWSEGEPFLASSMKRWIAQLAGLRTLITLDRLRFAS